jgi:hypothetical protein
MTDEQKVAYVQAQAAAALIEAMGMVAENMQRDRHGFSMAYDAKAFQDVIENYGIHHNTVVGLFHNC